jgi:tRNA-specific 2-thiouridylase
VVVAMSGGVDSSIAAARMVAAGHDVVGLTMQLYDASGDPQRGRGGTCCSPAEVDMARRVCAQLGIPHYTVDERERFRDAVIDDFARTYAAGRTPNPCVRCNQHVKFGPLLARAALLGAERLVTGHYARVEDGPAGPVLRRAADASKDQSYFLFAMGREALAKVWFPLGDATKDDVRDEARALGLPNADAPDSQEICFVPGGDHGEVVRARIEALGLDAAALEPGPVVDQAGQPLGTHTGLHRVTVGQRRGLQIAGTARKYVLHVLPETRTVVAGEREALAVRELEVDDVQPLAPELATLRAGDGRGAGGGAAVAVQWRHRGEARPARIEPTPSGLRVRFEAPVEAVAPGQAAVVYAGDQVWGGGFIARTHR